MSIKFRVQDDNYMSDGIMIYTGADYRLLQE